MIKRLLKRTTESFARDLFNVYCDPIQKMRLDALDETVAYIKERAPDALAVRKHDRLLALCLERALEHAGPDDLICEFGVHRGKSVGQIAKIVAPRRVYGFDSFHGLPEDWAGWDAPRGVFDLKGKLPKTPANVTLVPGLFGDSLPGWLDRTPGRAAFLHVDCDLYSSTKSVFDDLAPRIEAGTVILFDEYFNYANWRNHELKAFQEFVSGSGLSYRYLAYSTRQTVSYPHLRSPETVLELVFRLLL